MSGANEQWSLKIDPWITHAVDAGDYQQEDGETRIPALIEISVRDGGPDFANLAEVMGGIGNILAIRVTPEQLRELALMPEVLSIEASRPGYADWD